MSQYGGRKFTVFQSTLPMRGATYPSRRFLYGLDHFNPHSPCGERPRIKSKTGFNVTISIHTPHAGSDISGRRTARLPARISIHTPHAGSDTQPCGRGMTAHISIHTPHAGSDVIALDAAVLSSAFQSTLPMRGATYFTL